MEAARARNALAASEEAREPVEAHRAEPRGAGHAGRALHQLRERVLPDELLVRPLRQRCLRVEHHVERDAQRVRGGQAVGVERERERVDARLLGSHVEADDAVLDTHREGAGLQFEVDLNLTARPLDDHVGLPHEGDELLRHRERHVEAVEVAHVALPLLRHGVVEGGVGGLQLVVPLDERRVLVALGEDRVDLLLGRAVGHREHLLGRGPGRRLLGRCLVRGGVHGGFGGGHFGLHRCTIAMLFCKSISLEFCSGDLLWGELIAILTQRLNNVNNNLEISTPITPRYWKLCF